ncbi:MAG: hypothetical protein JST67_08440 [Bacteroidetes bacterium]|nr:hypothetical protein [Bacteroidota bacterium]
MSQKKEDKYPRNRAVISFSLSKEELEQLKNAAYAAKCNFSQYIRTQLKLTTNK